MAARYVEMNSEAMSSPLGIEAGPAARRAMSRENDATQRLEMKISREAARIIKLKVNQNATNWKLKEELCHLNTIRETQQQNIIELQMQYETLDGMYQNELRMRDDTMNIVQSSKSICDILEEHCIRMSETLSRCQTDRKRLCEAYQKVVEVVRDVKSKHARAEEAQLANIVNLQQRISSMSNNKEELRKHWKDAKNVLETLIVDLQERLNLADRQVQEFRKSLFDMTARNELLKNEMCQNNRDVDEKNQRIKQLESELAAVKSEYAEKTNEMTRKIYEREQCFFEEEKKNAVLSRALVNQEEFTTSVQNRNTQLQDKIASVENDNSNLVKNSSKLQHDLQEMTHNLHCCQRDVNNLHQKNSEQTLQNQLTKQEMLGCQNKIDDLNLKNAQLVQKCEDNEKVIGRLQTELNKEIEASVLLTRASEETEASRVELRKREADEFKSRIAELENRHDMLRKTAETQISDMTTTYRRDLAAKSDTITKLMSNWKTETDLRCGLEARVDKLKKDVELGQEMILQKDNIIKAKNEEISNFTKIMEQHVKHKELLIKEILSLRRKLSQNVPEIHAVHGTPPPPPSHDAPHRAATQAENQGWSQTATPAPAAPAPAAPLGMPRKIVTVTSVGPTLPNYNFDFSDNSANENAPGGEDARLRSAHRSGTQRPVSRKRKSASSTDADYLPRTKEGKENNQPKRDLPTRTKKFFPSRNTK